MSYPIAALALGLAALAVPGCNPAAARTAGYDGRWAVELVTESGPCNASYRYAVAIRGGQVHLESGEDGARVSGQVGADGSVGLAVSKGHARGSGSGKLGARAGSGTWTVASLCSGRWTARRSGGRTALAD